MCYGFDRAKSKGRTSFPLKRAWIHQFLSQHLQQISGSRMLHRTRSAWYPFCEQHPECSEFPGNFRWNDDLGRSSRHHAGRIPSLMLFHPESRDQIYQSFQLCTQHRHNFLFSKIKLHFIYFKTWYFFKYSSSKIHKYILNWFFYWVDEGYVLINFLFLENHHIFKKFRKINPE